MGFVGRSYATGVAIGDINQDGWPDAFVGALGENEIWINQGDGTFCEHRGPPGNEPRYTTAVAVADLDGDAIADLIEGNYTETTELFDRRKSVHAPPSRFQPAGDRWYHQTPTGALVAEPLESPETPASYALGIVVGNFDRDPGNEILIGNDGRPNRWWVRTVDPGPGADGKGSAAWNDIAAAIGIGVDYAGAATASMGIATADFDGNARMDFLITNFWDQSSSLFLQQPGGRFVDRSGRWNVRDATTMLLGFGCQSLDIDLDGWPDTAAVNGHVVNAASQGYPFRMPPTLFRNRRIEFEAVGPRAGGYWQRPTLGRTMARLDWNRDGRPDLVINHLDAPAALLENQTDTKFHWIGIDLVGQRCERDAIGAKVVVTSPDRVRVGWRAAGDGYMATNAPTLHFGIGSETEVEVMVVWPDGTQSPTRVLSADACYRWVQDQTPFELSRPSPH